MAKPLGGVQPIVMNEVFYWLVRHCVFNSMMQSFHTCYHISGVDIRGGCEVMVHVIQISLKVHFDWALLQVDIINAFKSILCKAIF